MDYLFFVDDELDIMYEVINKLQICFHPYYAPEGQFTVDKSFELQASGKDIIIFADNNFISPICEIAKNGTLKDEKRFRKVAMFVTWTKHIGARLTCGFGLLKNDTAKLSNSSGEENRLLFLHGVDEIPSYIWKDIAFGYRNKVQDSFLIDIPLAGDKKYDFDDDLLYLSMEAAIIKIVQIIRCPDISPIDKFVCFANWYADHLYIAESVMFYAAAVFANIPNVALPKWSMSNDISKIMRGIKNQAWDITYISGWSKFYYNEGNEKCYMFATDDITQKIVVINTIPPGQVMDSLEAVFASKTDRMKLTQLFEEKFGEARILPFNDLKMEEKVSAVKKLIDKECKTLEEMVSRNR